MQRIIPEETQSESNLNSIAFYLALTGSGIGIGLLGGGGIGTLMFVAEHAKQKAIYCMLGGAVTTAVSLASYGIFKGCNKSEERETAPLTQPSNFYKNNI